MLNRYLADETVAITTNALHVFAFVSMPSHAMHISLEQLRPKFLHLPVSDHGILITTTWSSGVDPFMHDPPIDGSETSPLTKCCCWRRLTRPSRWLLVPVGGIARGRCSVCLVRIRLVWRSRCVCRHVLWFVIGCKKNHGQNGTQTKNRNGPFAGGGGDLPGGGAA